METFATLQSVKELDGGFKGTSKDRVLQHIVDGVNAKVAQFLDRIIIAESATDWFDVTYSRGPVFKVRGYPITSVSEVRVYDEAIGMDSYRVFNDIGEFQILEALPTGIRMVEIDYIGGMEADVVSLRSLFPEIVYEANLQVIFEYKRKKVIANTEIATAEGGSETYEPMVLRKPLVAVMRRHRKKGYVR